MRRIILVAVLLIPCGLWAAGRSQVQVVPVAMDEGNQSTPFNVTCTNSAWTVVVSSQPTRHSAIIQAASTNTQVVCVLPSTSTSPGSPACGSTSKGIDLAAGVAMTDYGTGQWVCRTSTTDQQVKGYWQMDKTDYGSILNEQ